MIHEWLNIRETETTTRKWVNPSVSARPLDFSTSAGRLLMEMTPSLITAIHVPRNNYATTWVVTRLAFLYPTCSRPTLVFVNNVIRLIGEIITAEFRTCQNKRAFSINSLPDIINAIYQLIYSKIRSVTLFLLISKIHSCECNEYIDIKILNTIIPITLINI